MCPMRPTEAPKHPIIYGWHYAWEPWESQRVPGNYAWGGMTAPGIPTVAPAVMYWVGRCMNEYRPRACPGTPELGAAFSGTPELGKELGFGAAFSRTPEYAACLGTQELGFGGAASSAFIFTTRSRSWPYMVCSSGNSISAAFSATPERAAFFTLGGLFLALRFLMLFSSVLQKPSDLNSSKNAGIPCFCASL